MAQKAIYEYDAKKLLADELPKCSTSTTFCYHGKLAVIQPETDFDRLVEANPWLTTEQLVVKPDQLVGKRGKSNMILLNATFDEVKAWVAERMNKEAVINNNKGILYRFLVEPFVPHEKEFYVSITSDRDNDIIHFSTEGGVDIEENWDKVTHIPIPLGTPLNSLNLEEHISDLGNLTGVVTAFLKTLFEVYIEQDFTFLELNPFAVTDDNQVVPLDVKARLDDTAAFIHIDGWGSPVDPIEFPAGFGHRIAPEEAFIESLDAQTGASLKLTILNRKARVWTMVAGGGASVIYADTIVDLGFGEEMANYGEYSGNPSAEHTELYAQTIIDLLSAEPDPEGRPKILLIGGGIANFTDVKATFKGIAAAITKSVDKLKTINCKIYVRRGGPNETEGLVMLKKLGEDLGIPIQVYDRNTHMTRIVRIALMEDA